MTRDSVLVERSAQLGQLGDALARARTRGGLVVLVRGPAGTGKTALVRAATAATSRVLTGWCEPTTTARPLGPVLDLVRRRLATVGGAPREVHEALMAELRARPVVAVVEDLHWADGATLDVLRFVARRIGTTRSALVCTTRDDELGAAHPTAAALGDVARVAAVVNVQLQPLSLEGVRALCEGSELDARAVHRTTGGNPFYVTEVVAAGAGVPVAVNDAVLARLAGLDPAARRVAEAVALAPDGLAVATAATVAGHGVDAADRAVAGGVLVADRTTLRFRHDIARSVVAASLPAGRRVAGHRALLDDLLAHGTDDLTAVVHHALHGDRGDVVVEHGRAAAREAFERLAPQQAAEVLEAVLAQGSAVPVDERAVLHVELARYLRAADRADEAVAVADVAVGHARAAEDHDLLARALVVRAHARWATGDSAGARRDADAAVQVAADSSPSDVLLDALDQVAYLAMLARQAAPARAAIARHRSVADALGRPASEVCEEMAACVDVISDRPDAGLGRLEELAATARMRGDRVLELNLQGMLASGGGEVRRYAVALRALDRVLELGRDRGVDVYLDYLRAWAARVAFEQGRWDDATALADGMPTPEPHTASTALAVVGRVRVRRGDPGARQALEAALAANRTGELQHRWSAACGLAELAWLQGRRDEVAPAVHEAFALALDTDSAWATGELGFWAWRGGAVDVLPPYAAQPFALHVAGDWHGAADAWRAIGCPYEVALALLDGDEAAVREALDLFVELGARPAADLARSRLRALGVAVVPRGRRATTLANPAELTARQVDVLRLVAAGLDNGQIAARLHLSKRTVERHVGAVFGKLGVTTRAAAIARAHALGVTPETVVDGPVG